MAGELLERIQEQQLIRDREYHQNRDMGTITGTMRKTPVIVLGDAKPIIH